jgi:hypothetical protein
MVEVRGRIERNPTDADKMSRMQHSGRKSVGRLIEKPCLDRRLTNAVWTDGLSWLVFGCRNFHRRPVNPDGSAMQEPLNAAAKRSGKRLRAFQRVGSLIDDTLRVEIPDHVAEGARSFFLHAVDEHSLDALPSRMLDVWFPLPAAHANDAVTSFHQLWREIGADVPRTADDNDSHQRAIIAGRSSAPWASLEQAPGSTGCMFP